MMFAHGSYLRQYLNEHSSNTLSSDDALFCIYQMIRIEMYVFINIHGFLVGFDVKELMLLEQSALI